MYSINNLPLTHNGENIAHDITLEAKGNELVPVVFKRLIASRWYSDNDVAPGWMPGAYDAARHLLMWAEKTDAAKRLEAQAEQTMNDAFRHLLFLNGVMPSGK